MINVFIKYHAERFPLVFSAEPSKRVLKASNEIGANTSNRPD